MEKSASIPTIRELAKLVEKDTGTVSRWLKRPDWTFDRKGPWKPEIVPEILRWVANNLRAPTIDHDPGKPKGGRLTELREEKLTEEIRKLRAQANTFEAAYARECGKLLDAPAVEQEWASIGSVVRNDFQNLSSQLVPLALNHGMPNEAAATFGQQVEEVVLGILKRLSGVAQGEANGIV